MAPSAALHGGGDSGEGVASPPVTGDTMEFMKEIGWLPNHDKSGGTVIHSFEVRPRKLVIRPIGLLRLSLVGSVIYPLSLLACFSYALNDIQRQVWRSY